MVCEQCQDLKTTTALLCKNHLPIELNNDIKKYIRCMQCDDRCNHKRFITLSKKHNITNIIFYYIIKGVKKELATPKTKQQVNKFSMEFVRYITHCIQFYVNGKFWNNRMTQTQIYYQGKIENMKVKHQINLRSFFIDFYGEICNKKMKKEDALFMEKYIAKLLSST